MDTNLAEQQAVSLFEAIETLVLPHPNENRLTLSVGITVCTPTEEITFK